MKFVVKQPNDFCHLSPLKSQLDLKTVKRKQKSIKWGIFWSFVYIKTLLALGTLKLAEKYVSYSF